MEVQVKNLPKSRVELTINLPSEELEDYIKKAIQQLSLSQKVKGFRPGKAPQELVEKKLGPEKIFKEAVDLAVKESYVKAIRTNEFETFGPPQIELLEIAPKKPLVFKAEVAVLPKVEPGDYKTLKLKPGKIEVTEKEIDDVLARLHKSRAKYNNVGRPAQKGDRVEVDFTASVRGAVIEGGDSKQHPLIVGEGHFMAGFEDKLVGMKEGEEANFSLRAPKDYYRKELAEKKIDFKVKMNLVQEVILPKLDDSFAKDLGKFTSLEELRKSVKEGLTEEKKAREQEKWRVTIVESLLEKSSFEIPEEMLVAELEKMESEFSTSLGRMNIDQEHYLAHLKKSMADLKKDWRGQAQKRVRAALVLREIARREGIVVTEADVEERANQILKNVPDPSQLQNINVDSLKDYVRTLVRNEKVFQLLERTIVDRA